MDIVLNIFGQRVPIWQFVASLVMLALTISIGFTVGQADFLPLISQYLVFFLLYWTIFQSVQSKNEIPFFIGVALLLRLVLVFSFPLLSDDVYRFIWDGRLWLAGINPFSALPSFYLEAGNEVAGLSPELYEKLNSPEYFTVYPPVAQASFALAAWLSPNSLWGSVLVMKGILLLFEVGNLLLIPRLLQRLKLPARNVLIYALNPLVIMEVMGNLHFEGAMVFFFLLAFLELIRGRWWLAAPYWALSVASKLLPLMFLPFLVRRLSIKALAGFGLLFIVSIGLLFGPIYSADLLQNMRTSLDLYFQNFEFNGSIYYIVREVGTWWVGHNPIKTVGPVMAQITLIGILFLAFLSPPEKWKNFPRLLLLAISLYLLLATTIHPWYTILPLVLCLFTRFRYPVLWTGVIYLTYINYSYTPFYENLWIVGLEYTLVIGFALYEWRFWESTT